MKKKSFQSNWHKRGLRRLAFIFSWRPKKVKKKFIKRWTVIPYRNFKQNNRFFNGTMLKVDTPRGLTLFLILFAEDISWKEFRDNLYPTPTQCYICCAAVADLNIDWNSFIFTYGGQKFGNMCITVSTLLLRELKFQILITTIVLNFPLFDIS